MSMWRSQPRVATKLTLSTEQRSRQMVGAGEQLAGNDAHLHGENSGKPVTIRGGDARLGLMARVSDSVLVVKPYAHVVRAFQCSYNSQRIVAWGWADVQRRPSGM